MIISSKSNLKEAIKIRELYKNKKIIFTNGCFDVIHYGHIDYLRRSKKLGDILVVGLNSDISVKRIKGKERPINFEINRAEVLSELRSVDYVIIFEESNPVELMKALNPDIYTKGKDYENRDIPEKKLMDIMKKKTVFLDYITGLSSTSIINKSKLWKFY